MYASVIGDPWNTLDSEASSDSRYRPGRVQVSKSTEKTNVCFAKLTWDDISQRPQRRLDLANRARIPGHEVLIGRDQFRRGR